MSNHVALVGPAVTDDSYSWFCPEKYKSNCPAEGRGFPTQADAEADAIAAGHPIGSDDDLPGRFDGIPGLVWYAKVRKVRGADLNVGDWLDSLDHRGARMIYGVRAAKPGSGFREVCFGGGFTVYADGSSDSEIVRDDVEYDVVDPDSQVAPDGSAL